MATASNNQNPPTGAAAGGVTGWFANQVANVGEFAMRRVAGVGDVTIFAIKTVGWLFSRRQRRDVLLPAFYQIGVLSLPVVALTGLFIGMVLAVQSYAQFKALGLETRLGSVINLSLERRSDLDRLNLSLECARKSPVDDAVEGVLEPFQQAHHASE
jgi:phospholipid/cholesterol/gamma-HCH transport system permease protein